MAETEGHGATVTVEECDGEWLVRIVENGVEQVASYPREEYACSFADGQRTRLHIDAVADGRTVT